MSLKRPSSSRSPGAFTGDARVFCRAAATPLGRNLRGGAASRLHDVCLARAYARVPALWRFHVVHHADLDLDASTALRFHFGELALSVPWRAAQIIGISVSPRALSIWQTGLMLAIIFHHSNIRLPLEVERWISPVVVTPRMHGIHHSIVPAESDSNWSSGLAVWDWLHGTVRLNVPQEAVEIGVEAYRSPQDVTLPALIKMPFGSQPATLLRPDGETPHRVVSTGPVSQLRS